MAIDNLPGGFFVPARDEIRDQYQKDVRFHVPGAPIGDGSQAFAEGSVVADTVAPLYGDAVSIASDADLDDKTFEGLKAEARGMGIPELLPASGGAGFVAIRASIGGVAIDEGRELYDEKSSLRFQCLTTGTYYDESENKGGVPVVGLDTGPSTNLSAGTALTWRSPPPGLGARARILSDTDGQGLTGGRNEESANELRDRIRSERATPAAAGNVAHVRRLVKKAAATLGIAIQEVFVYSGILGPCTYGVAFTLRPARPGGSRSPNATQIAQVRNFISGELYEDDGILMCTVLEQAVTCKLEIEWSPGPVGWVDIDPWPKAPDDFRVTAATAPHATSFSVLGATPSAPPPQIGQTIAFYNAAGSAFVQKRIANVATLGGGAYTLTVDLTNNASDLSYVPVVDERFCPWSPSLGLLVEPMAREFDKLGPGEQVETFFDAGPRQRRFPLNPWPSTIRHKMLDGVDDLPQIADVQWVAPAIPFVTPVGSAGVSSNLLTFGALLVFPA